MKCSAEFHFHPNKPHKCYHVTCTDRGEFKHVNHRCFIQPVQPKEDTTQEDAFEDPMAFQNEDDDQNEEKGPPPPPVLNFADIECSLTEERVFMSNLICWSSEKDDETVVYGNRRSNCTLFSGKSPKGHGPWINSAMTASL